MKPLFCQDCPINQYTTGYVPIKIGRNSILAVGEAAGEQESLQSLPFIGGAGVWLDSMCRSAGMHKADLNIVNVIGCRPNDNVFPTSPDWKATSRGDGFRAVEYCRKHHFLPAVQLKNWSKIIALGDQALNALTGRRGILKWRGSPLPLMGGSETKVIPTLHPAYLMRQANLFSVAVRDIQKPTTLPPEIYNLYPTLDDVVNFRSPIFSFDLEWDREGRITFCGLSNKLYHSLVIPWTEEFIPELKRIFENATDIVGQNIIMADWQYIQTLGWNVTAKLHDIMLLQHLIQPDMRHGLAFICSVFTNKVFWKGGGKEKDEEEEGEVVYESTGPQWKTWNDPMAIPRELGGYGGCASADESFRLYNARDTDGTFQAWFPIRDTLKKWDMDSIYWNVSVPVAHECRIMGNRGIRIDKTKVKDINVELNAQIIELDKQLPEGLKSYAIQVNKLVPAPDGIWTEKTVFCKGRGRKNTHESIEYRFTNPDQEYTCSVCERTIRSGKMRQPKRIKVPQSEMVYPWRSALQIQAYADGIGCKQVMNRKTGNTTTGKNARKLWGREHIEFTLVDKIKKLSTICSNFAKESLLNYDRVYFALLPHGTSEGRLSCKGLRQGIDPNIQNQPKSIRKIYIPDRPDWGFVEADWSQGENWLTAFLAKDTERLERLGTPGYDEHSELASRCFKVLVTKDNENKYLRGPGKVINHGKNYGMGPEHMQENLMLEGYSYSLSDVKEMNTEWAKMNAGTARWQQETVALGQSQGFLRNAFKRMRWFNTKRDANKMLAFLPASTLAEMMLRVIIALNPDKYRQEISNLELEIVANLPKDWLLAWVVHDSFVLTGPWETHREAAHQLKIVMEQKWKALGGFSLSTDIGASNVSWGDLHPVEGI